jgi:hypothetical protein
MRLGEMRLVKHKGLLVVGGTLLAAVLLATAGAGLAMQLEERTSKEAIAKKLAEKAKTLSGLSRRSHQTSKVLTLRQINKHLRSIGVNPKKVVVQRGNKNYAGPNCPGKGWNCTTAKQVVQFSLHHDDDDGVPANRYECGPNKVSGSNAGNDCVIVQSGTGNFSAKCVEYDSQTTGMTQAITQSCVITQTNTGTNQNRRLTAVVDQLITEKASGTTQDAQQRASITQSGVGTNTVLISQRVRQTIETENVLGPITHDQDALQVSCVNQARGRNLTGVFQSQNQEAEAENVTGPVTQRQNADFAPSATCAPTSSTVCLPGDAAIPNPNACADVFQDSNLLDKRNDAGLLQTINQNAEVESSPTAVVTQTQGNSDGGLLADVHQESGTPGGTPDKNHYITSQHERQTLNNVNVLDDFQQQFGDQRCCFGTQTGNVDDSCTTNQESIQQSNGGEQLTILSAFCLSFPGGDVELHQHAVNNTEDETEDFSGTGAGESTLVCEDSSCASSSGFTTTATFTDTFGGITLLGG